MLSTAKSAAQTQKNADECTVEPQNEGLYWGANLASFFDPQKAMATVLTIKSIAMPVDYSPSGAGVGGVRISRIIMSP